MSKVVEVFNTLQMNLRSDPSKKQSAYIELSKIISSAYTQSMGSDEGFCFKFNLPLTQVNKLFSIVDIDPQDLDDAFTSDWKLPIRKEEARMYHDSYYQILLLLVFYGIKERDPKFSDNAMLVFLFKVWNGRKTRYLKFCDKNVMKYVVSNMCNNRHLFAKFDSPLSLLKDHFVPTLLKKYGPMASRDPKKLQALFSQSWVRINQIFAQSFRTDIKSGKKYAQAGILPMYMEAKKQGWSMGSTSISGVDEEGPAFDEYTTTSNRDEIITTTCDAITMNPNPRYSQDFINQLNKIYKVKKATIEQILKALHDHRFHDYHHDILSIILARTNVTQKSDICSPNYQSLIKKNIISSKNNVDARKVQKLCNMLLESIFKERLQLNFKVYSNVLQIQLRSIVINGIVHNLRANVCRGQMIK